MVSKLNEHYQLLKAEEISEEYQVLAALTGAIAENEEAIDLLIETMTVLDIILLGQNSVEKSMGSRLKSINQNISSSNKADIHFT